MPDKSRGASDQKVAGSSPAGHTIFSSGEEPLLPPLQPKPISQDHKILLKNYPQTFFLIFLISNLLLSYGGFPLQVELWVGFIGFLLPAFLLIADQFSQPRTLQPSAPEEPSESFTKRFGTFLLITALLIQAVNMTWLRHFPHLDTTFVTYFSVNLSQHWVWKFLVGTSQTPALFNWILSFFFRFLEPSFFSMYLFFFLVAVATIALAYYFARALQWKPYITFCFFGLSCGYWVLYTDQYGVEMTFKLFLEIALFGLLLLLAQKPSGPHPPGLFIAVGALTGLGFITDIAWPSIALFITLLFFYLSRKLGRKVIGAFLAALSGFLVLFLLLIFREHYGEHIHRLWALASPSNASNLGFNILTYLSALFWKSYPNSFGGFWGGMLNPVYSSFFFLGLLECCTKKNKVWITGLLLGFGIGLGPGMVSYQLDLFRMLHIYPLLLFVAGIGFQSFLAQSKTDLRKILALSIFSFSLALDLHHLQVQKDAMKSPQIIQAVDQLDETHRQKGVGAILVELRQNFWDRSLPLATYPYNAEANPRWSWQDANWLAFLVTDDYQPYLSPRFPDLQWVDLGPNVLRPDVHWTLGILPINRKNFPALLPWLEFDRRLQQITIQVMDAEPFISQKDIINELLTAEPSAWKDPFLATCFYEKILLSLPPDDLSEAHSLASKALRYGYPLAFFKKLAFPPVSVRSESSF